MQDLAVSDGTVLKLFSQRKKFDFWAYGPVEAVKPISKATERNCAQKHLINFIVIMALTRMFSNWENLELSGNLVNLEKSGWEMT